MQLLRLYLPLLCLQAAHGAVLPNGACVRRQSSKGSLSLTSSTTTTSSTSASTMVTTLATTTSYHRSFALPPSSPAAVATAVALTNISGILVSTPTPDVNEIADAVQPLAITKTTLRLEVSSTGVPFIRPIQANLSLAHPTVLGSNIPVTQVTRPSNTTTTQSAGPPSSKPSQLYSGPEAAFPDESEWVDFSNLWQLNADACNTASNADKGATIEQDIHTIAQASGVDPRVIFAVILQESGCQLNVPTTNDGVRNPGLMQSHNGVSYNGTDASILQMIRDGVQGTNQPEGSGIQQCIENYGVFTGLRAYNSGANGVDSQNLTSIPAGTGFEMYCSDIANRLTGAKLEQL